MMSTWQYLKLIGYITWRGLVNHAEARRTKTSKAGVQEGSDGEAAERIRVWDAVQDEEAQEEVVEWCCPCHCRPGCDCSAEPNCLCPCHDWQLEGPDH